MRRFQICPANGARTECISRLNPGPTGALWVEPGRERTRQPVFWYLSIDCLFNRATCLCTNGRTLQLPVPSMMKSCALR